MNPKKRPIVPDAIRAALLAAGLLAVFGCMPRPDPTGPTPSPAGDARRAAAVAEMRAKAQSVETGPYPTIAPQPAGPFAHPQSVTHVAAQQAELELLAKRRSGGVSEAELARLEERAIELRRLAQDSNAGQ
jgi:hypothetical protein